MQSSDRLRIVTKYTIGTDDVDVDPATDLGIIVERSPTDANWGGVAEGTIAAMLTMLKRLRERDRHLKEGGGWRGQQLQGTYLGARADGYAGITLGLIWLGLIVTGLWWFGLRQSRRLRGFLYSLDHRRRRFLRCCGLHGSSSAICRPSRSRWNLTTVINLRA